jgi:hypothetical protein
MDRRRAEQNRLANRVHINERSEPSAANQYGVFLNIPYDQAFEPLYLAYIAGLCAFRLEPKSTLQIPGGERRLDRILGLIGSCRYSFHDLSRVELNLKRPATPLQHAVSNSAWPSHGRDFASHPIHGVSLSRIAGERANRSAT